jgi:hypothetical protein
MIELEFAELHGPIFVKGTNLPAKLSLGTAPGQRRDIKIFYDRNHREVHVHFKDKIAIVPRENVATMIEKASSDILKKDRDEWVSAGIGIEPDYYNEKEKVNKKTAQVDSPMHHVFAGEGHGKLRDK